MKQPATFGELLRGYRRAEGLTQRDLATRAGVSLRALRDIEQGKVNRPHAQSVEGLLAALRLEPDQRDRLMSAMGPPHAKGHLPRLLVSVLGPVTVQRGETPLHLRTSMVRHLLGLLAIQPGRLVSTDEIVDVLWDGRMPKTSGPLVQTYVAQLRVLLEPERRSSTATRTLVAARGGYRLDLGEDQLDLLRFDALAGSARRISAADPPAAIETYARALACWRGPILAGLDSRLRHHPAAVAAADRRIAVTLAFADLAIQRGAFDDALPALRAVAGDQPLHEGLLARLMLALAGTGQQAAALEVFTTLRTRLADELGIEPGPDIQQAYLRVLHQDLPPRERVGAGSGPVVAPTVRPAQLPADVSAFTGRQSSLTRLDELLPAPDAADRGLVIAVIAGTPGVGKTALAVHWAHRVRDRFPDGQLYINLGGYTAGALRPIDALARFLPALGLPADKVPSEEDGAAAYFRSVLAGKQMLIVLDNAADAIQVRPLLPGSPGSVVLITSRDRLAGLVAYDGARRLTLDVLTPEEAHTLLARLLGAERVAGAPGAVAELAQACAHLPLALRIAAANLANHERKRIADYLTELRGNRLAALTADDDDQAAVRAAFDLSYGALAPETQVLFRLLGVQPGRDITAAAAAALAGAEPARARQWLDSLAAAHLAAEHRDGGYALHDLLRLYATELSHDIDGEADRQAAIRRLLDHYLGTADAAADLLYPEAVRLPQPPPETATARPLRFDSPEAALAWLDAELPNLVAIVHHAALHGPRQVAWLVSDALRYYFILREHTVDWQATARAGLAAAEAEGNVAAQAATQLSLVSSYLSQSRYPAAIEHANRALELARCCGWWHLQGAAHNGIGIAYIRSGRLPEAIESFTESEACNGRAGKLISQATSRSNLGIVYRDMGRLREAIRHYERALALYRRLESRGGESKTLTSLGEAYGDHGEHDVALEHFHQALAIHRQIGDRPGEAEALRGIAVVHRDAGRPSEAVEPARTALALARDAANLNGEMGALNALGTVYHRLGRQREALEHHHRALRLSHEVGERYAEAEALLGLAAAHYRLGDHGRALGLAERAHHVAAECGYGLLEGEAIARRATVHLDLGHRDHAADLARMALGIHREAGYRVGEARSRRLLDEALGLADAVAARRARA